MIVIRTADSELDMIYKFYLDAKDDDTIGTTIVDDGFGGIKAEHNNSILLDDKIVYFMIEAMRMNGFPQVVSDDDYNSLETETVWRGERCASYGWNLINNSTYHYGSGARGIGIYTTDMKSRAEIYCGASYDSNDGVVEEFKINPNAKILNHEDAREILNTLRAILNGTYKSSDLPELLMNPENKVMQTRFLELISFLREKDNDEFTDFFVQSHVNLLAIYLGFDGLYVNGDCVIFNRGALIVSEGEKKRIEELQLLEQEQMEI